MSAKSVHNAARENCDLAGARYERMAATLNTDLERLGTIRIEGLRVRAEAAAILQQNASDLGESSNIDIPTFQRWQVQYEAVSAAATAGVTVGSVVLGGASVVGAYALVGAVGVASTGTAIAGLSGAAASSATMAALGGGAVASGGLGIVGGMVALTGIGTVVAVPAMVGGLLYMRHRKTKQATAKLHLLTERLTNRGVFIEWCGERVRSDGQTVTAATNLAQLRLSEYQRPGPPNDRPTDGLHEAVQALSQAIEKPTLTEEELQLLQTDPLRRSPAFG